MGMCCTVHCEFCMEFVDSLLTAVDRPFEATCNSSNGRLKIIFFFAFPIKLMFALLRSSASGLDWSTDFFHC